MYKQIALGCCAILLCAQFTNQKSTGYHERPAINVFGTLVDTSGQQTELENITIRGAVDRIPVYYMPPKKADGSYSNPESNKLLLDLRKVTRMKSVIPEGQTVGQTLSINNREYVPIEVIFNDDSKQDYIVEKRRRIVADDKTGGGSEREVSFHAVKELIIKGDKPQDPKPEEQQGVRYRRPADVMAGVIDGLSSFKDNVKNGVHSFFEKIWYT